MSFSEKKVQAVRQVNSMTRFKQCAIYMDRHHRELDLIEKSDT